jgi:hypothetical protein
MICLLYRDFLLLASALRTDQIYTVQSCIGLNELKIEDIDNGRGKEPTVPIQLDDRSLKAILGEVLNILYNDLF